MVHRKVNSPEHLKNRVLFLDTPSKLRENAFFRISLTYNSYLLCMYKLQENLVSTFSAFLGAHHKPEVGYFFPNSQNTFFFMIIFVKKLLQWFLFEVVEDILPFVLNTK